MEVEWDGRKAEANLRKHGISFEEAGTVLYDERALAISDDRFAEPRIVLIGVDLLGRILLVVGTLRGDRFRLISGRRASSSERRRYNEGR